jgi:hypothetical protein
LYVILRLDQSFSDLWFLITFSDNVSRVFHLFRLLCDLRQTADKCDDLGALLSTNGLVLPFDVALYAGWVDGELASFAYDDLTFSVMYKQLLERIHNVV